MTSFNVRRAFCVGSFFLAALWTATPLPAQPMGEDFAWPADDIKTLQASFVRVYVDPVRSDTTLGSLYLMDGSKMHLRVNYPVQQVMEVDGARTLVYYPEDQKAFLFTGSMDTELPFVSALRSSLLPDYGLSASGFVVTKQEYLADTLVVSWTGSIAPEGMAPPTVELRSVDDLLHSIAVGGAEGQLHTTFSDYVLRDAQMVPSVIVTRILKDGQMYGLEAIQFNNLSINKQTPAKIASFSLPPDIPVEEKEW